jgi:glc operon protein GlcG
MRAFLAALAVGGVSASAWAGAPAYVEKKSISSAAAKKAIAACEALAVKNGWHEVIQVVDEAGNEMAFLKMDGAGFNTIDFAQQKARTALRIQAQSTDLLDRIARGQTAVFTWGLLAGTGGIPIKLDGVTIGAVGVSGSGGPNDEACAKAAAEAAVS